MRILLATALALVSSINLLGQCPDADFQVNATACMQEVLELTNTSSNSSTQEWVFCNNVFENAPTSRKEISGYGAVYYSRMIEHGEDSILFFISQTQNKLIGLRVTDFAPFTYEPHAEIDLSPFLTNPAGFDIANDNGTWITLITNIASPFRLVRLSLNQTLTGVDEGVDLTSTSGLNLNTPFELRIQKTDVGFFAFGANSTAPVSQQVVRLAFGASLTNTPSVSYIALPSASQAASFAFDNQCGQWNLFVSSRNGKIFRLDFGGSLADSPTVTDLTLSSAINDPGGLALVREHDIIFLIIQSRNGFIYSAALTTIDDATAEINSFGNLKSSNRDWGIETFSANGITYMLTANFNTNASGGFYSLQFDMHCPASKTTSQSENETISFNEAGTFKITLVATSDVGADRISKEVIVSEFAAPTMTIVNPPDYCVSSSVPFGFESNHDIESQTWEFGDGTSQVQEASPLHAYQSSGDFIVNVVVVDINGCTAKNESQVYIYPSPTASFDTPDQVCTNNQISILNTTIGSYNDVLAYQWYVNNQPAGSERDLAHTFTTTGPKEIKLITSIPGCSDEEVKTIPAVHAGPLIDFSFEGQCATEEISFTTEVSETVTDHFWSFDDGTSSTEVNPSHQFDFSGTYQVSLTATSLNGCNNSSTQEITVYSKPTPDFSIQPPPLACSGIAMPFSDLTPDPLDSDIASWLWRFGESTETVLTPDAEFNFANAGDYDVSLTVTSDAGCEASVDKVVTIYPSPDAAISRTTACLGKPTTFTATGDEIQSYYWEIGTAYYEDSEITHTFQNAGDHPLMLTVYGDNNCVTTLNQTVNISQTLIPNFSFTNHCVGHETAFTDITEDGQDPIASRVWNFAGTSGESSASPTHVFNSVGEQNVSLAVTTGSGCIYATERTISVLAPPVASFSASPETGAAPLEVQFTNTSTNASDWLWTFNDQAGSTSADQSPIQIFTEVGDYKVELLARNSAGCESRFDKIIPVVTPLPGVDLKLISTSENSDGSIRVIVTIENKGNTFIKDLPVEIDISGNTSLTEIVEGPIAPGSLYNLVLSYSINRVNNLDFLCADVLLENDLAPGGNRMCIQFEQSIFIFNPYPNPATDEVRFEWISPAETELTIQLSDSFGKTMLYEKVGATVGLNQHRIDVSKLPPGVYFVILKEKRIVKTYRIVVSGQN